MADEVITIDDQISNCLRELDNAYATAGPDIMQNGRKVAKSQFINDLVSQLKQLHDIKRTGGAITLSVDWAGTAYGDDE